MSVKQTLPDLVSLDQSFMFDGATKSGYSWLDVMQCSSRSADGAARCPLTHCLWEDKRRRSEYFDLRKTLKRNTRIQNVQSPTPDCAFGPTAFSVVSMNMLPHKIVFHLLPVCPRHVKFGVERVQEERKNYREASEEGCLVMWVTSTRGNSSWGTSRSLLSTLINKNGLNRCHNQRNSASAGLLHPGSI